MKQIKRIIFVSTSGTCRAPMAAHIMSETELGKEIAILARGLVVLMPEPMNQAMALVETSTDQRLWNPKTSLRGLLSSR